MEDTLNRLDEAEADDSIDDDTISTLMDIIENFHKEKATIKYCEELYAYVEDELFKRWEKLDDSLLNDTINIGVLDENISDVPNQHILLCYEILIQILRFLNQHYAEHRDALPQMFTKDFITQIFSYMNMYHYSESDKVEQFFEEYLYFPALRDRFTDLHQFIYQTVFIKLSQTSDDHETVNRAAGNLCKLFRFFLQKGFHKHNRIAFDAQKVGKLILRLHTLPYYAIFHGELDRLTEVFLRISPGSLPFITCRLIDQFKKMHSEASNINRRLLFVSELHYILKLCRHFIDSPEPLPASSSSSSTDLLLPMQKKPLSSANLQSHFHNQASGDSASQPQRLSLPATPSKSPSLKQEFKKRIFPKVLEFFEENFKLRHAKLMDASIVFWTKNRQLLLENKELVVERFLPIFEGTDYIIENCPLQLLLKVDLLRIKQSLAAK